MVNPSAICPEEKDNIKLIRLELPFRFKNFADKYILDEKIKNFYHEKIALHEDFIG